MTKKLVVTSLIILILLSGVLYIRKVLLALEEIGKPLIKVERLDFSEVNDSLFVKTKVWGLTGDHKITIISQKSDLDFKVDSLKDYVFKGFGDVLLRKKSGVLEIYSFSEPIIPIDFKSSVSIKIFKIKNQTELMEIKKKGDFIEVQ